MRATNRTVRLVTGADAIGTAEQKVAAVQEHIASSRDLATSLDLDPKGSI